MAWIYLVLLLALAQYLYFMVRVGRGRLQYKVPAPKTTGNEQWERLYRVQMNTLELLVLYLPSLVLFGLLISPTWGAGIGLVFVIGRGLYGHSYAQAPEKRGPGMALSMLSCIVLLLGAVYGALSSALA